MGHYIPQYRQAKFVHHVCEVSVADHDIQCNLWNVASFFLARYGPLSFLEYSFISKTDRSCDAHFADHDIQQSVLEKLASVFLQVLCTAVVIFM